MVFNCRAVEGSGVQALSAGLALESRMVACNPKISDTRANTTAGGVLLADGGIAGQQCSAKHGADE